MTLPGHYEFIRGNPGFFEIFKLTLAVWGCFCILSISDVALEQGGWQSKGMERRKVSFLVKRTKELMESMTGRRFSWRRGCTSLHGWWRRKGWRNALPRVMLFEEKMVKTFQALPPPPLVPPQPGL